MWKLPVYRYRSDTKTATSPWSHGVGCRQHIVTGKKNHCDGCASEIEYHVLRLKGYVIVEHLKTHNNGILYAPLPLGPIVFICMQLNFQTKLAKLWNKRLAPPFRIIGPPPSWKVLEKRERKCLSTHQLRERLNIIWYLLRNSKRPTIQ